MRIKYLNNLLRLLKNVRRLKRLNFATEFCHEGNLQIKLPKIRYIDLFSKHNRNLSQRCFDFTTRPTAESLLRKIVYLLIKSGFIESSKSMIDIGSWLGDNAIVWAKLINRGGVYAIDPSQENLQFGNMIASLNGIKNIQWLQAICADEPNISLTIGGGNINHATFVKSSERVGAVKFVSSTLDRIIPKELHSSISLIHIDVEGFEEKVLFGAKNIILESNPVVIFEQHISKENPSEIISFLKRHDYNVYMINEVLPGCDYDCRNFLAFSSSKILPILPFPKHHNGRSEGIWYATIGDMLIKIA